MYIPDRVNRGWKPLPQSKIALWIYEVSFSIWLAVFLARGGARMKLQGMTNIEWRLTNGGIASLSLFKIDRVHYSMLTVRRRRIRCWTFDVQCSLVSFSIWLDARGQRRRSYETTSTMYMPDRVNRGWKPLPQSKIALWIYKVSFSIWLDARGHRRRWHLVWNYIYNEYTRPF